MYFLFLVYWLSSLLSLVEWSFRCSPYTSEDELLSIFVCFIFLDLRWWLASFDSDLLLQPLVWNFSVRFWFSSSWALRILSFSHFIDSILVFMSFTVCNNSEELVVKSSGIGSLGRFPIWVTGDSSFSYSYILPTSAC